MNIPQITVGTFGFKTLSSIIEVVRTAVEADCKGFDTSPSYKTAGMLGRAIKECANTYGMSGDEFFIVDKIDAWQMHAGRGNVLSYIYNSLVELQVSVLDLLLIHWPIPEYFEATWESLLRAKEMGLVREVGICNTRVRHLEKLSNSGLPLPKVVQIERHPLRVDAHSMEYNRKNNIVTQAYSPICQMHPLLAKSNILKELSTRHKKTIAQIIIRWHVQTNSNPVIMSTKPSRIVENLSIFDFKLDAVEVDEISNLDQDYKLFLESWACPGF